MADLGKQYTVLVCTECWNNKFDSFGCHNCGNNVIPDPMDRYHEASEIVHRTFTTLKSHMDQLHEVEKEYKSRPLTTEEKLELAMKALIYAENHHQGSHSEVGVSLRETIKQLKED